MERADLEQWKAREVARLLALVESERRYYQEIASAIPVGLLIVSRDLAIISANRAVRSIFGLSASPLRSRLDTLLPASVLDRVSDVLQTASPQTGIIDSEPKTGRRLRIGIVAIRSLDDETGAEALLSIEDLTNTESLGVPVSGALGLITGNLAEHHLLEDQWIQSERVQALSKLAARLAHDLNNLLMIVTGHGEEVLNRLSPDSPVAADVHEILNASERMSGLTGHLLAFTRRQPVPVSSVELGSVLNAIEQRPGVQLSLAAQPILVKTGAERLSQIVTSLIEGQAQVSIETARVEIQADLKRTAVPLKPGSYGVIGITLNARAFDADARRGWFEAVLPPKAEPDDWATAVTRAYGVIRQWGGDIAVTAAPGGGTLLRIFLESGPEPGGPTAASAVVAAPAEPPSKTILVVEDEPGIRALVQKILSRHGYRILEAANGEQALAVIAEHRNAIDLLITDVMMPRMGGPELVEHLRARGIDIGVLYVSGYTDDPNIYATKFPPGTAFLAKPFTLAALVDKVRELLKTRF